MAIPAKVVEQRAAALRSLLPSGTVLSTGYAGPIGGAGTSSVVVGVGRRIEDVVVTFRWMAYQHLLSVALDPGRDYGDDDDDESAAGTSEMWTPADWAQNARGWLEEELDTGLVARASRQRRDDVIELNEPWWPSDSRFFLSDIDAIGGDLDGLWQSPGLFELDGFDTSTVRPLRADRTLISWHRAYLNSRSGSPCVGHAAVVRVDEETARIEFCDVRPDVPASVTLELCLMAAHRASWLGARRVLTDVNDPALAVLGFRRTGSAAELDTQFLDVDHPAAARLVAQTSKWRPSWKLRLRRRRIGQWTRVGV